MPAKQHPKGHEHRRPSSSNGDKASANEPNGGKASANERNGGKAFANEQKKTTTTKHL
jgi:hypothetical protein